MLRVAGALAIQAAMPQLGRAVFIIDCRGQCRTCVRAGASPRTKSAASLPAADLVRGDVALLEAGNRGSADHLTQETHRLSVISPMLSAESVPDDFAVGDTLNAGTFMVEGEAWAAVMATGAATRRVQIAHLTRADHHPKRPFARELERKVRLIAGIARTVGTAFFAFSLLLARQSANGFLFAIGVNLALGASYAGARELLPHRSLLQVAIEVERATLAGGAGSGRGRLRGRASCDCDEARKDSGAWVRPAVTGAPMAVPGSEGSTHKEGAQNTTTHTVGSPGSQAPPGR